MTKEVKRDKTAHRCSISHAFAGNVCLFYVESITGSLLFPGPLLVVGRYVSFRVRLLEHLHCSANEYEKLQSVHLSK